MVDKTTNTWLLIQPTAARVSPLNGSGTDVAFSIGLTAQPHLVVGDKPSARLAPLPPLQESSPGNGFHIALPVELSHETATELLSKAIVGRQYVFPGNRKERISKVDVYGNGVKTVIQVDLKGDIKVRIYFSGSPAFDVLTNTISVPDLDYDINTRNWLATIANWLLHDGFRDSLRTKAKWDVTSQVASAKAMLQSALNRRIDEHSQLTGTIAALRPLGVISTGAAFHLVAVADGEASLRSQ